MPGLKPGDLILPPTETGYDTEGKYGERDTEGCRRVFVTREPALAARYAASYPRGDCYQVEPLTRLEEDPDSILPDAVKACERARVVRVTRRAVRLGRDGRPTR